MRKHAIQATLLPQLLAEPLLDAAREVAAKYLDQGLAPPDDPSALCSTHWLPLVEGSWPRAPTAAHEPQHAIERAVLEVTVAAARAQLAGRWPSPERSTLHVQGVEWWLQEQWPDDEPKEHHTDVVVGLSDDGGSCSHGSPLLSSVLYLSATGGPTAVFNQTCPHGEPPRPMLPSAVALAFPSPGSLLLFAGDLVHCVLHPPPLLATPPTEQAPRRTLLVNFWGVRPPGAADVLLPSLPPLPPPLCVPAETEPEAAAVPAAPEPAVLPCAVPFARHQRPWRNQQLPDELGSQACAVLGQAPSESAVPPCRRMLVIGYAPSAPASDGADAAPPPAAEPWKWWRDD